MSTMYFAVTVEVERESGLFAARDDISEKIVDAIQDAESNADLSGLGANSDSQYNIVAFDVEELEKKDRKALYAEYDAMVVAEMPGDPELRKTVKDLKAQIADLEKKLAAATGKVSALAAERSNDTTRIWQSDEHGISALDEDSPKTFLLDGRYDFVNFQYGPRWDEKFAVRMDEHGSLMVRVDSFGRGNLVVVPCSSNEIQISLIEVPREGR